ncbi:hypothetical protein ACROYT_G020647 [Oculina patagonica]
MPDPVDPKTEKNKSEKKRLRVSSTEDNEDSDAIVELTVSEFQRIITRVTKIEEEAKHREARIAHLEKELILAKEEIKNIKTTSTELGESLQFTQREHEEVFERINECEREQAAHDNDIIKQEIYSRRWNLIFYKIPERQEENCKALVKQVLIKDLKMDPSEVQSVMFCGVHRLGKRSRGRTRPLIARFTCRADRDKVWKLRRNLKNSHVNLGEDLPKRVQDLRKDVLVPAMKRARRDPRNKAHVNGDKLIVNGKAYFHFNIPARWLNAEQEDQDAEHDEESPDINASATDFTYETTVDFVCISYTASTLCKFYQIHQIPSENANFFLTPLQIYNHSTTMTNQPTFPIYKSPRGMLSKETYSSNETAKIWETEWGGKVLFNHGTYHSRGVMILFNPKLDCQIDEVVRDKNGRFLSTKITLDDCQIVLTNVYAPNDTNQQVLFFKEIQKSLSKFAQEKFIIGGDFNCALSPSDKEGGNPTSKKQSVIKEIDNLCHLYSLCDIWRSLNPTAKQFTWRNKSFKVQCRLDYFLISKELSSTTIKCDILYAPNTDHSAIQLHLLSEELKQQKGPGFWKFNSSLLEDKQYVSDLRKNLTNFIEKYRDVEDLGLKWDLVKMEIRGFTVKFSKIKARRRRDEEVFLQKKINELFTKAEKNRNNRPIICELNSTRARLEKIMALKTRGTIIRSRARWHEQGERNNKYFLNLEKRNHSRKLVSKLKLPNDSVITNQFDILEEQSKFYKSLYTSQHAENVKKPEEGVFFNPSNISALSDHEQALCEGLITENEAFKALKEFAAAKTPGTDGLSTEFLKFFWPELKSLIVESFNYAFLNGSLSISQRRGIISLIPKKNKDKTILENLRPISLLNVDYKILTKVLANRLEKVLPKIINPDQTGYVKGRYIGENIRLIQDLMFHLDKENSPGIAVFVDFRKAFDTIEWNYLEKALTLFNFGPDFLQWFKTVYSNISSCILNNGHASHFFSLTRGVRQGCPISGLLFVIGLDLLARAIKNHDLIKGITIRNHEIKTTMYADDTTVFLSDTESVPHLLELLNQFKVVSGLEVNSTKTEAMWLGKWKNRCDTPFNFKWPVDPICALGVFFSYDTTKADKLNFDEKLRSMEKVLNIWKNRKLTLIGRINIVKTLALSKLIFNSSNLSLPKDLPDTINNMIFNFIWEGKPPKIKKTTVIGQKNKGGLKMIDFKLLRIITSNLQLLNKDFYGMVSPKKA